jgi:hypothetical protein
VQLLLLRMGFLSLGGDDAARVLRAEVGSPLLSWLKPDVWPPLDKVIFGAALAAWHDPVVAPRVVTFALGVFTGAALVWLAWELTRDRTIAWLTAGLAALVPYRAIFGVSTTGEVFLFLPIVVAAALVVRWLRNGSRRALLVAALVLGIATTTRYEAWFIALVFGVMVLVAKRARYVSTRDMVVVALVLGVFPLAWLASAALSAGPINFLTITRQQTAVAMPSTVRILANSAASRFLFELLWVPGDMGGPGAPVLWFGVAGLTGWFFAGGWRRAWVLTLYVPMALLTVAMIITRSAPGEPWRLAGIWVLLTLPVGETVAVGWLRRRRWFYSGLAVFVLVVTGAVWALRDMQIAEQTAMTWQEVGLARSLAASSDRVLLEARPGGYEFLDLVAASGRPEIFELSRGGDPYLLALFIGRLDRWREMRPDLVARFAQQRVDLTDPDVVAGFACGPYSRIVVRSDEARSALERVGLVLLEERAGWWLYMPSARCPASATATEQANHRERDRPGDT